MRFSRRLRRTPRPLTFNGFLTLCLLAACTGWILGIFYP